MIDWILHIDKHLVEMINQYGPWFYLILFVVIFAETAFVIFPFLPGDSLLFGVGLIAADEDKNLSIPVLFILLTSAAILGNMVNYWVGKTFGQRLFDRKNSKIFTQSNLAKTHRFFEHYGGKTIVVTRFVPVIRAFAPFVAGMGAMEFPKFMIYNVIGGVLWVSVCMFAGVFLGQIPAVKQHFELAIIGLVVVSLLPIVIEMIIHKRNKKKHALQAAQESEAAGDNTVV